tara:strand:+ start:181 stop:381 length:201 start_codon:yes stop_codon:yes gene_type:complete
VAVVAVVVFILTLHRVLEVLEVVVLVLRYNMAMVIPALQILAEAVAEVLMVTLEVEYKKEEMEVLA